MCTSVFFCFFGLISDQVNVIVSTSPGGVQRVAIALVHHLISRVTLVSRWEYVWWSCICSFSCKKCVLQTGWQTGLLHPHLCKLEQSSVGQHKQGWIQLHGEFPSRNLPCNCSLFQVMSYEAGVVWTPTTFSKEFFTSKPFKERRPGTQEFPLHYDLPITPYSGNQKPWLMDYMMQ